MRTPMEGIPNGHGTYTNGNNVSLSSCIGLRATSTGDLYIRMSKDAAATFVSTPVVSGDWIPGHVAQLSSSSTANCIYYTRS